MATEVSSSSATSAAVIFPRACHEQEGGHESVRAHGSSDLEAATKWYTEVPGVLPYYDQVPGYIEFRVGDYLDELGFVDAAYGPPPIDKPAGQIIYWHVDDLDASLHRLLSLGATVNQPRTDYGNFSTASVVDPFGNLEAIMINPHYAEIFERVPVGQGRTRHADGLTACPPT